MSEIGDEIIRSNMKSVEWKMTMPDYNEDGTANPVGDAAYWRTRAEKAEAERDALRARVVELEAALKKEHELSDALYLLLADDPNTKLLADKILITAYPLR